MHSGVFYISERRRPPPKRRGARGSLPHPLDVPGLSCYWSLIGSRILSFRRHENHWPWMILKVSTATETVYNVARLPLRQLGFLCGLIVQFVAQLVIVQHVHFTINRSTRQVEFRSTPVSKVLFFVLFFCIIFLRYFWSTSAHHALHFNAHQLEMHRYCEVNQKRWHFFGMWVSSLVKCFIFAICAYSFYIIFIEWRRSSSADVNKFCSYANKS